MITLIKDTTVVTMTETGVLKNADVVIEDGKIRSVGQSEESLTPDELINGSGCVVMPGLVNSHTHVVMTLLRGYGGDVDLETWLNQYIFPAEERLNGRCVKNGALLGIAESIASGVTSLSDMYYFSDYIAEAVGSSGINANLSRSIVDFDGGFDKGSASYIEMDNLFRKWHGHDSGRIRVDASVHAEYTSGPNAWEKVREWAMEHKLRMHVHVSETKKEHDACRIRHALSPVETLDKHGLFDMPAMAAHCVWLSDEDIEILVNRSVSVLHSPCSNLKLASGIARVPDLLYAGANIALSTDGAASNNSLDMFEEIKLVSLLHKGNNMDPMTVPALTALEMATVNGAKAQGRENETGAIRPGFWADLIMLDFDRPHLTPCLDPVSNLVYSARGGDVVLNMVRGRILYKDGLFKTIDIDEVMREVREYAVPLLTGGE